MTDRETYVEVGNLVAAGTGMTQARGDSYQRYVLQLTAP